ncbi:hypothetical protein TNCV_540921 [Trichonephila clavipes]|nr:hypothetical protein TNCV_540921 [Trichonephila clavipes]
MCSTQNAFTNTSVCTNSSLSYRLHKKRRKRFTELFVKNMPRSFASHGQREEEKTLILSLIHIRVEHFSGCVALTMCQKELNMEVEKKRKLIIQSFWSASFRINPAGNLRKRVSGGITLASRGEVMCTSSR